MKKIRKIMVSVLSAAVMSTCSLSVSAALEKSDSENYDFYSCSDYYWINDNGEKEQAFLDRYYKFETDYSGTYEEYSRTYRYVFVTINNDTACAELDNVLGNITIAH